jgi:hypothetical protein
MQQHTRLNGFQHALDIGMDRGESMIYISSVCDTITGLDTDLTMIDLGLANYRMSGRYNPALVHGHYIPEDKLLIDVDLEYFSNIDLVKIDAGERTPQILEMLRELFLRLSPTVFICHDGSFTDQTIWDTMLTEHGYLSQVVSRDQLDCTHGVFIAYLKQEQTDEIQQTQTNEATPKTTQPQGLR